MTNWITKLKVGDEVIVARSRGPRSIERVEKINKTTIKVDGVLYHFSGYERGGGWNSRYIEECTDERREEVAGEIEKRRYVFYFQNKSWSGESLEKLRELYKIDKQLK